MKELNIIQNKNDVYAVGFRSRLKLFILQSYIFLFRKRVCLLNTLFTKQQNIHNWFIKNGKIVVLNGDIGKIKGLYYEVNRRAIELSEIYFNKFIKGSFFLKYSERLMKTKKFDCYIKKEFVYDFFDVLVGLYLIKEYSNDKKIIMVDTPLNRFAINEFHRKNNAAFKICWLNFSVFEILGLFLYYSYRILKTLFINGFTYRDRIKIKLYKEAVWGLTRPQLRDDFLIDNRHFKKDDICFYSYNLEDEGRKRAVEQLKREGFHVVNLNRCRLNIKNGLLKFISIFLFQPLLMSIILILDRMGYQIENMLKFYIGSLPHFLFLTNYSAKCHISNSDNGEIAETILMNKLGCKNVIYHWSDTTTLKKDALYAYTVHNIYYTWGPIHHEFHKEDLFNDKAEVVGCIFLKAYFDSIDKNRKNRENKNGKKILVCDTSFSNSIHFSEQFYLDYLDLVIEMLEEINDAEFIFKPKNSKKATMNGFTDEKRRRIYLEKIKILNENTRFTYLDNNLQLETLIPMSDIVINMGMNSPATIALILRKEAVYYDTTGNDMHPFTQYKNKVVFDDKKLIIEHVKEILNKKRSVFDYIDPDLLNQYEPYKDSKALERLIQALSKEVGIR